jgi:hypothetical protein
MASSIKKPGSARLFCYQWAIGGKSRRGAGFRQRRFD